MLLIIDLRHHSSNKILASSSFNLCFQFTKLSTQLIIDFLYFELYIFQINFSLRSSLKIIVVNPFSIISLQEFSNSIISLLCLWMEKRKLWSCKQVKSDRCSWKSRPLLAETYLFKPMLPLSSRHTK